MPTHDVELAVRPHGTLFLRPLGGSLRGESGLDLAGVKRVREAFAKGAGAGFLHLASKELHSELGPSLAFGRRIGEAYLKDFSHRAPGEERIEVLPSDDVATELVESSPPLRGGEYLSVASIVRAWSQIHSQVIEELSAFDNSPQRYLQSLNPQWHALGRVVFHLAERKNEREKPFAFLATYIPEGEPRGAQRHLSLAQALENYRGDKDALLRMLRPVRAAAERSEFIRDLVDSGEVYIPLAWTAEQASRFLQALPACEGCGLVVRIPSRWVHHRPPRPQVQLTLGQKGPAGFGAQALMDFKLSVAIDGQRLSAAEIRALLKGGSGLRLLKGRWVEVDPQQLQAALDRFEGLAEAAAEDGFSLIDAMRLMSGVEESAAGTPEKDSEENDTKWWGVEAGSWLRETLAKLCDPKRSRSINPKPELKAELRPYQQEGVAWLELLWQLGLGGCLADDMGLGKTIQVIALLVALRRDEKIGPTLLVVPTSLLGNWQGEFERFAPHLGVRIAHRSAVGAAQLQDPAEFLAGGCDAVITTYGTLKRLSWLAERDWDIVVLDEAQAIKNPNTRQTRAVKALRSRWRLALTGTPIENSLGDLWSLFDYLCPGLLGGRSAFRAMVQTMSAETGPGYAPLKTLLRPYVLRRLKSDKRIITDLPDKTEVDVWCSLTKKQAALYQKGVKSLAEELSKAEGMKRRAVVLAYLTRFKQICNHPSQWENDGGYDPKLSGKFRRLAELCDPIAERQEKLILFTQYRALCAPLAGHLESIFGSPGLILHGATGVRKRQEMVEKFQREDGPSFFVISLRAGGVGLNLTEASHVIHFDRWWNPAVEDQATDRAFRIGQRRNVLVHKFICRGTLEEKIDALIRSKSELAREVLSSDSQLKLSELDPDELLTVVALDLDRALGS